MTLINQSANTQTTTTTTHNQIDTLSRKATAGTLKKIYTATGNNRIRELIHSLQSDFTILDNNEKDCNALKSISDAYDIYLIAYEYLYDMI